MTDEELAEVRAFIATARWTFAKTMPKNPHWYTVRGQTPTELFEWFVMFIREHGFEKQFGRTTYTYLEVDDYRYWTMGNTLPITKIINRRLVEGKKLPQASLGLYDD